MSLAGFTHCQVFSATKFREREDLGDAVTRWLTAHPEVDVVEAVVRQSSDAAYHALTIVVFFNVRAIGRVAA